MFSISPKAKRNIQRILPFGVIWLVLGWLILLIEYMALEGFENSPSEAIQMDFVIFIYASLAVTVVGLFVGTIELVYLNDLFAKKSFAKKIFYKLLIYTALLFFIILINYPIAASLELNTNVLDKRVWERYLNYLTSMTHVSTFLQMGVSLGASLFYAEISDSIGHGVLLNFFTGKYHKPLEEKRIFLFADMRSSTTIAEQLGHIAYFNLLKAYYVDFSDAIIRHSGEVYQYVGDEIVISWPYKEGIYKNNCLQCFFAMKKDLKKRGEWYKQHFGVSPTFKAGLHVGTVTTGEIGVVKKDIIFTGDVLNATARIQGLCNLYEVDLLISSKLLEKLDLTSEFQAKSMGKNELRGKQENIELFTVVKEDN